MKNTDKTVIITYIILGVIAVSMFIWILIIAPWDKYDITANVMNRNIQTAVSGDTATEDASAPIAIATPTPFVKKKTNEANQGCIGDEGLVW